MLARITTATFTIAIGLTIAGTSGADAGQLSGAEIQDTVGGKRIYLAAPLGGEFPLNYRSNGRVDGDGRATGLGRFAAPTDSGRWWVNGNRLCQQWQEWYDGRQFCFTLSRESETRLRWVRDDGLSGRARIAN